MLDVCLLGCGGMMPLPKRFLTALLVRHEGSNVLIDCGEATQVALHMSGFSTKTSTTSFSPTTTATTLAGCQGCS